MKTNKSGKTAMSSKVPAHMTMNGSIFNANANTISSVGSNRSAVASRGIQTTNNVLQANTAKSVSNVSNSQSSQSTRESEANEENSRVNLSNYDLII